MLRNAYGFCSILVPVYLLASAFTCLASTFSFRKCVYLSFSLVPFFTAVVIEKIYHSMAKIFSIMNADGTYYSVMTPFTVLRIVLTITIAALIMLIEYLIAGIVAEKIRFGKEDSVSHNNLNELKYTFTKKESDGQFPLLDKDEIESEINANLKDNAIENAENDETDNATDIGIGSGIKNQIAKDEEDKDDIPVQENTFSEIPPSENLNSDDLEITKDNWKEVTPKIIENEYAHAFDSLNLEAVKTQAEKQREEDEKIVVPRKFKMYTDLTQNPPEAKSIELPEEDEDSSVVPGLYQKRNDNYLLNSNESEMHRLSAFNEAREAEKILDQEKKKKEEEEKAALKKEDPVDESFYGLTSEELEAENQDLEISDEKPAAQPKNFDEVFNIDSYKSSAIQEDILEDDDLIIQSRQVKFTPDTDDSFQEFDDSDIDGDLTGLDESIHYEDDLLDPSTIDASELSEKTSISSELSDDFAEPQIEDEIEIPDFTENEATVGEEVSDEEFVPEEYIENQDEFEDEEQPYDESNDSYESSSEESSFDEIENDADENSEDEFDESELDAESESNEEDFDISIDGDEIISDDEDSGMYDDDENRNDAVVKLDEKFNDYENTRTLVAKNSRHESASSTKPADEPEIPAAPKRPVKKGPYIIPTDILEQYADQQYWIIDDETKQAGVDLKKTLNEFGIEAEVTGIRKGPVVTMFEILPAPGVRLNKIVALQDNIALSLAASSIRIVAPIPGKHAMGIEVPNKKRAVVSFREIIEMNLPAFNKMSIPVILGKDISGDPQVIDLAKTPHLLIAGSTGAGKSVCVNSMLLSILYKRSPQQVKLVLIDPKVVELKLYNDIPHLLTPVITEPKRALQALQYCLCEMERRYALLDRMSVRDIISYNNRIQERNIAAEKLPYIIVIIDEFADLMATTGKELESTIARLAAMSRAVGIHLVLATQRPSVNVITGLIKANIPSRIAFMVASRQDSGIIIDKTGAEKLLGKGDMLYSSAADPFPKRIQGTLVTDNEVENVVNEVKQFGEPEYIDDEIFVEDDDVEDAEPSLFDGGDDPLYSKALNIVVEAGKASASYIQRRLKIGYNRAARLVEEMEERGIVGPANGSKPREIIHLP